MFSNWSDLVSTIKQSFGSLSKSNPKMVKAYMALGDAAAENNVLDAKTRELISWPWPSLLAVTAVLAPTPKPPSPLAPPVKKSQQPWPPRSR